MILLLEKIILLHYLLDKIFIKQFIILKIIKFRNEGIFDSIGTQLKLVDHSFNMFYVNISDICDVKYIMYDNLLELVFNIIKNSNIRVLTHEQETKIELYYGEQNYFQKLQIQENWFSDITKDQKKN